MTIMFADISQMLILADIVDWFKLIVPAIFVIFWVISQISGSKEQARKPPIKQRGGPPPDPNDGNIRGEIEDFLRRVKQQAGIPDENVDDDWDEEAEFDRPQPVKAQQAQVLEAEVIEPPISAGLPSSAGSSARGYAIDRFAQQAQMLGAEVDQADENMEKHTHEVFDHAVGEMDNAVGGQSSSDGSDRPATVPQAAGDIRRMLSGADGVRKAVVMSEILNRPADRW